MPDRSPEGRRSYSYIPDDGMGFAACPDCRTYFPPVHLDG